MFILAVWHLVALQSLFQTCVYNSGPVYSLLDNALGFSFAISNNKERVKMFLPKLEIL